MDKGIPFIKPKLVGRRFDDHRLPISVMEDFSVLEELIFDLAKKVYLDKNPSRKRVPNHFTDNVSIKLENLEEGSVIPNLLLVAVTSLSTPSLPNVSNGYFHYFEEARDKVFEIVEKANAGEVHDIDIKYLNYFNRIGRNLKDDECIDFLNDSSSQRNVTFTKNTRRRILLSRNEKLEYTENISEVVLISSVDKKQDSFKVELNGSILECDLKSEFQDTVLAGLSGYDYNLYVLLKGVGTFNEQMKLINIDSIESMDILDPHDMSIRLKELAQLKTGWYDGEEGLELSKESLDVFEELFYNFYSDQLPLPATFPTLSGGIILEWKKDNNELSVEIDLTDFKAIVFYFDMLEDNNDFEEKVDLQKEDDWERLNSIVKKHLADD